MARYLPQFPHPSYAVACLWLPQPALEHSALELRQKRLRVFRQPQNCGHVSRSVNCDRQWEVGRAWSRWFEDRTRVKVLVLAHAVLTPRIVTCFFFLMILGGWGGWGGGILG